MKTLSILPVLLFAAFGTSAQIAITNASLTYTEQFNTLDSVGTNLSSMPPGWHFYEWGGASANAVYRASPGTGITGDTYSYGATGSGERALGALSSSGVPNVSYGVRFVNLTGAYINAVTISFKAEQWRRSGSGSKDSVRFYYSTAVGKQNTDTAFSSWINVPALLITSITTAAPAAAVNGNDTFQVIAVSLAISLPAGDTLSMRWHDCNVSGNDDGLAIDSFTAVFGIGPPFSSYKPLITTLSPAPNSLNVPAGSSCSITFDKTIRQGGAGNIYIKDRVARTTQIISASSANVAVSGNKATISGLGLAAGRSYHITFDSTAFDTSGFLSTGIYDTTRWVFSTMAAAGLPTVGDLPWSIAAVNPGRNGVVTLYCQSPTPLSLNMEVYDLRGKEVFRTTFATQAAGSRLQIRTGLAPGTYLIRIGRKAEAIALKVQLE